jgi:flagellar hook-associated protein 3 FlgL
MMDRVSTLDLSSIITNGALQVETNLSKAQVQESSGLVAQDFGTLGGTDTGQMLNLENEISQSQTWASEAQTVGSRTQTMYSSLGTMSTILTQLQSRISQAMSAADNSGLAVAVKNIQQELVSEMNVQVGGRYLFAGSNIEQAPVNLTNYPSTAPYDPTKADTSYYTGDNVIESVRVSSQQTLNYGVTADNPAFEETLRATEAVIQASSVTASSALSPAATSPSATTTVPADTFSINGGGTVTVNAGDSLATIAASINAAAGPTGVSAQVVGSGSSYQLQITTGNLTPITFSGGAGGALAALGLANVAAPNQAQLTSNLQQALGVSNLAQTDLANLQNSVSDVSKQLSDAQDQQTTFVTLLQNSLSNVKDVDAGQAASQVSQYQTQLQASYMALATVSKINLAQYL